MAWRSIVITNPARLSLRHGQLVIEQTDRITVPIEDISTIVIESLQVTLSAQLLTELATSKIVVYVCDKKHTPCGIFTPFHTHSRQLKIMNAQIGMAKPLVKRCWQQIIRQKVTNQALCLKYLGMSNSAELIALSKKVESGDTSGVEAHAARLYFHELLQSDTRQDDTTVNAALNYGYAIIRGAVARSIAAHGLLPSLGIHHCNELNPFNLADDLMEVFRPIVDLWVIQNIANDKQLLLEHRVSLINLLHHNIGMNEDQLAVLTAIDLMVGSFVTACLNSDYKAIRLPTLLELKVHQYG